MERRTKWSGTKTGPTISPSMRELLAAPAIWCQVQAVHKGAMIGGMQGVQLGAANAMLAKDCASV